MSLGSTVITLTPLQDVRAAVWTRLSTSDLGAGVKLLREGQRVGMPYVAVGPAYKGAGSTDPERGAVNCIVQIDAYASSTGGGAAKASAMQAAVAAALSSAPITVPLTLADGSTQQSRPFTPLVEDDVLNPELQDALDGPTYAQRFVRYKFALTT